MAEYGSELEAVEGIEVDEKWGITTCRIGEFQCFHFYPHKARGEGFFAAVARKKEGVVRRQSPKPRRKLFVLPVKSDVQELERWVDDVSNICFRQIGDTMYGYHRSVVDDVVALSEVLSVIYSGVCMGQIFKRKLRPEHALALFVGMNDAAVPSVEVGEADALDYLRRQDISASQFEEGINRVMYRGVAIGFVKRIGARCNNMYPKDLRIMKL
jgi:NOL1/NOP2/fmu family ribosome biogenesis protein